MDPLRPTASVAVEAWASRVRAGRAQLERLREIEDPGDYYAPMARRFAQDPRRTDDASLESLRSMARPDDTWLDIGAGGGRYALPLALAVRRVHAVDPSPSMLDVLRDGMATYGIDAIDTTADRWPLQRGPVEADVALMAHVGYDIEAFGAFLDAAEASARRRCVAIMRTSDTRRPSHLLWPDVHHEPRVPYPMLQELVVLLIARGATPEVTLVERATWGYGSREQLLEAARRQSWLRPGSDKDRLLVSLVAERATERDGQWELDWSPLWDGVVSWVPPAGAGSART